MADTLALIYEGGEKHRSLIAARPEEWRQKPESIKRLAGAYYLKDKYKEFEALILSLPREQRQNYESVSFLVEASNGLEKYAEAEALLVPIQKEGAKNIQWHRRRAENFSGQDRFPEAVASIKKAFALDPFNGALKQALKFYETLAKL